MWECSIDLANYLSSLDIAFRGLKVIEVGAYLGISNLTTLFHFLIEISAFAPQ